jgi:hypothetical protein
MLRPMLAGNNHEWCQISGTAKGRTDVGNVPLTDDELWRAIAENTNAMSRLVYQQLEFDAYIGPNDPYRH